MTTRLFLLCTLTLCGGALKTSAQDHHGDHLPPQSGHNDNALHFSHPLVAESVSPDTKLRLEHEFEQFGDDEGNAQTLALEGEYAFHPSFSVEAVVPVGIVDTEGGAGQSALGNIGIALKFANDAFADYGVLLGYGIEFGLPTGSDEKGIGSDHLLGYEPFLNAGYKKDALEILAFAKFGIPTRQQEGEEVETEFGYNLSVLYHLTRQLQGLLEIDGERALSGGEGESAASITPGVKLLPTKNRRLALGFGVSIPVSDQTEFDVRTVFSTFYHF